MPGRYDKAVCDTELKLRSKIFAEMRSVWRPRPEFQVATQPPAETGGGKSESDVDTETSVTPTGTVAREDRNSDISYLEE